jgi:HK97 family phage prohead protease
MSSLIETTDFCSTRMNAAAQSANEFYKTETVRLNEERRLFGVELRKTSDPGQRAELQTALAENNLEWAGLERGWRNSSLREKLSRGGKRAGPNISKMGFEKRIALEATSSGAVIAQSRQKTDTRNSIFGYAAKFSRESQNLGGFTEVIQKGAFSEVLKNGCDCRALYNHDPNFLLGRTKSGTLRLSEDSIGLRFTCDLIPDDPIADGVMRRILRGDISGCSFQFCVETDRWVFAKRPGEIDRREILKIGQLLDICPCVFPAYLDTSVTVLTAPTRSAYDVKRMLVESKALLAEEKRIDFQYEQAGRVIARLSKR